MDCTRTVIPLSALLIFEALLLFSSCDRADTACTDARTQIEDQIKDLCAGEEPYKTSAFCTECVSHGYFSVDSECRCQTLTFDEDSCFYYTGNTGLEKVRAALDYARDTCKNRSPTQVADGGTVDSANGDSGS